MEENFFTNKDVFHFPSCKLKLITFVQTIYASIVYHELNKLALQTAIVKQASKTNYKNVQMNLNTQTPLFQKVTVEVSWKKSLIN